MHTGQHGLDMSVRELLDNLADSPGWIVQSLPLRGNHNVDSIN